ncbi:hypothetical protein N7510_001952 [Penicillium lagena]|uniref:uncharacterized protein n=1 Tax=Penicillium lagena TaxID=94218 RepID=UPI002540F373|nr:uncharacterized protein N7510_001952 [Penicillium lagena]KAJ5625643.1 hypothetical protein N7510_001952 [Penicillium lagena]
MLSWTPFASQYERLLIFPSCWAARSGCTTTCTVQEEDQPCSIGIWSSITIVPPTVGKLLRSRPGRQPDMAAAVFNTTASSCPP